MQREQSTETQITGAFGTCLLYTSTEFEWRQSNGPIRITEVEVRGDIERPVVLGMHGREHQTHGARYAFSGRVALWVVLAGVTHGEGRNGFGCQDEVLRLHGGVLHLSLIHI